MKSFEKIKKEIDPNKLYRPMEIVKKQWISNQNDLGDYYFVLKLIKKNRLRAIDRGLGKNPYYAIMGSEIIRYLRTIMK